MKLAKITFLLSFLAFVLISCIEENELVDQEEFTVESVKSHFENNIIPNTNSRISAEREILWGLAESRLVSIGEALTFPLIYNGNLYAGEDETFLTKVE